ncbi:MAG: nitroreductase family protein [Rickettsiales bacterium]|jgi:nitroreductase|nr:nitroreductase family protein [Rickettsiales bacterium]
MKLETIDIIHRRRSIRQFKDVPIADEHMHMILSAGMTAPSAMNKQPWRFVLIDDDKIKRKVVEIATYAQMVTQSPVSVLACYDRKSSFQDFGVIDTSACVQNMLLAATALGIGSVWTGIGDRELAEHRKLFKLPEHIVPIGLIVFGYSDTEFSTRDYFDAKKIHSNVW